MVVTGEMLAARFAEILPRFDERRRLYLASEARALGHGGIRLAARAAGAREQGLGIAGHGGAARLRDAPAGSSVRVHSGQLWLSGVARFP